MMTEDIDRFWMTHAYDLARLSPDQSTQVGSIIVNDNKVLGEGFNQFPKGVAYTAERWERPLKYSFIEHAERNAVFDAAYQGNSTWGATMYATGAACAECARAIVQTGISRVVSHPRISHGAWGESVALGDKIMEEGGVKLEIFEEFLGKKIRLEGIEVIR